MKKSLYVVTVTLFAVFFSGISAYADNTLKVWLPVDTWKKTLGFYEDHLDEFRKKTPRCKNGVCANSIRELRGEILDGFRK